MEGGNERAVGREGGLLEAGHRDWVREGGMQGAVGSGGVCQSLTAQHRNCTGMVAPERTEGRSRGGSGSSTGAGSCARRRWRSRPAGRPALVRPTPEAVRENALPIFLFQCENRWLQVACWSCLWVQAGEWPVVARSTCRRARYQNSLRSLSLRCGRSDSLETAGCCGPARWCTRRSRKVP